LVVAQIILLSQWFSKTNMVKKPSKKNQPKKPSKNGRVQINLSEMALWSSWTWGQKNHMGDFFD